ncbi:protein TILLER ANGLE CONTROL 1-like isoform X2 [Rutidosis leptorrhynchoides]|uniref:protein TILLER ANGLE CONTROL 1-like isoform X2 n=1 Tax=Rutidosis leptorrhynchoides TaxID=125765 RepID=UPI003A991D97
MKIFDWVHRRLHHKHEVVQDVTKADFTEIRKDKVALLENEGLDNVFDGWKEGIFAIGTFGFDPELPKDYKPDDNTYLCDINHKHLQYVCENVNEDDECDCDQEAEMELPLVVKASKHGFFHAEANDQLECEKNTKSNDIEDGVEDTNEVKKEKNASERITLADLFLADSENNLLKNKKLAYDQDQVKVKYNPTDQSNMKHESNDDRVSLISDKKLKKEHAIRPFKKMNRMMRKMLRKKIHPDLEIQKDGVRTKPVRLPGSVHVNA